MNEPSVSSPLNGLLEDCRKNLKSVILAIAFVIVSIGLLSTVFAEPTVVRVSDSADRAKIAGLEKDVARLADDARAESKKRKDGEKVMEDMTAEYTAAFAGVVSLADPDVFARHVLAAKRSRGGETLPFWKAYTKAFWAAQKSMGLGAYTKDHAFHAVKYLLFANDAMMLDGLWRSVTFVTSVGTVAFSYQKELSLFTRYPKLLARSPVVVPPQESGAPTFEWLRQHLAEPYDMANATEQDLEDAEFFLKFLIRKDEEFGPGAVQVIVNITQEVVEHLPVPTQIDSGRKQPAHMKF